MRTPSHMTSQQTRRPPRLVAHQSRFQLEPSDLGLRGSFPPTIYKIATIISNTTPTSTLAE